MSVYDQKFPCDQLSSLLCCSLETPVSDSDFSVNHRGNEKVQGATMQKVLG